MEAYGHHGALVAKTRAKSYGPWAAREVAHGLSANCIPSGSGDTYDEFRSAARAGNKKGFDCSPNLSTRV